MRVAVLHWREYSPCIRDIDDASEVLLIPCSGHVLTVLLLGGRFDRAPASVLLAGLDGGLQPTLLHASS